MTRKDRNTKPPASESQRQVREYLSEQGYTEYSLNDHDRHDAHWQKRSGVQAQAPAETLKGYIDIHEYRHEELIAVRPDLAGRIHDSYEVGSTFETPHGWLQMKFYGLNAEHLPERLAVIEEEIRVIQRRLLGEDL